MKKLFVIALFALMILPAVMASTATFPYQKALDYKIICNNNGTLCSSPTLCNFTLFYPNQSIVVNNKLMTNQTSFHNYSLSSNQLSSFGSYCGYATCNDAGFLKDSSFCFDVTPNGEKLANDNFLIFLYILFTVTVFALIYLLVMNIARVATYSETVLTLAVSWCVYFTFLIEYWLISNYSTSNLLRDNIGIFTTITAFTHVVLPLISLIITMMVKSMELKRPLSAQELIGGKYG